MTQMMCIFQPVAGIQPFFCFFVFFQVFFDLYISVSPSCVDLSPSGFAWLDSPVPGRRQEAERLQVSPFGEVAVGRWGGEGGGGEVGGRVGGRKERRWRKTCHLS